MLPVVLSYLVVAQVDTVAKNHWDVPLVHAVVFLVHPLIEDVCVQNPAGVHLQRTQTHHAQLGVKVRKHPRSF